MSSGFLGMEQTETHNRQAISRFSQVRSRSIELDPAMAADPVDDVGFEPFAIRHVPDQDALVFFEFDQFGKVSRNAETAFIIHIGAGYDSSMNLRFEERYLHASQSSV